VGRSHATVGAVSEALTLRFADPEHALKGVRLVAPHGLTAPTLEYAREDGGWSLTLPDPGVQRLEYELELVHADGGTETINDPGTPLRSPGAFGEKSVAELPGYAPPTWLDAPKAESRDEPLAIRTRALRRKVYGTLWSPEGSEPHDPLPLLVANDGPEYAELAGLTAYAAAMLVAGRLPPHRIALLRPDHRDEWYSASSAYGRALATEVIPALRGAYSTEGMPVGIGASLGGLAMLHAQRRHPHVLGGLFLQSGSFFTPRHDAQESGFPRFRRIVAFTRATLEAGRHHDPVPVILTCGVREENVHNNRLMAQALALQGYPAQLHELPDLHNFTAWRDALDPHLADLLTEAWATT
jgi:enterochelin esterase-like enzyme